MSKRDDERLAQIRAQVEEAARGNSRGATDRDWERKRTVILLNQLVDRVQAGVVDTESLVIWRVIELRAQGVRAEPFLTWRADGNVRHYSIRVRLPDGSVENGGEVFDYDAVV